MIWSSKKQERENEKLAATMVELESALDNRRAARYFGLLAAAVLVFCWILVALLPNFLVRIYAILGGFSSGPVMIASSVPLWSGFFLAYSELRIRIPDLETKKTLDGEMMASFSYNEESNRRWFAWIGAILFGLGNLALMIVAAWALNSNRLFFVDWPW